MGARKDETDMTTRKGEQDMSTYEVTIRDAGQTVRVYIAAESPEEACQQAISQSDDWTDPEHAWVCVEDEDGEPIWRANVR